jgi:UDP-GlcNAc:undecaprenyl-phosphate/decaprenyl-phosphate GlcNAc-1-phosphate transferase
MYAIILSVIVGFGLALVITPILIRLCEHSGWGRRIPALHHTHKEPVPRLGGLVLAVVFVTVETAIAFFYPAEWSQIPYRTEAFACCLAMFALGFLDDLSPLGAKRKLLAQIGIAFLAWALGMGIERFKVPFTDTVLELGGWGACLTLVWLVGTTNLINLIDGVDGLAAGISLMLMTLTAFVGTQGGHFEMLAAGMAGGLIGFLRYNFPPARIFLGDGGAYFLGFQIGLFSLIDSQKGTVVAVLVAPLFVLALPIIDTTLAILRRGMHGLPILRADRQHIHHRLLRTGFSHRQVVLLSYLLTMLFLAFGLVTIWTRGQYVAVLLGIAVVVLVFCAGQFSFSREWFAVRRVMDDSLEMRQEIQYGVSLARSLALEGSRSRTVLELWKDLVTVARKLGFSEVKLNLVGGQRCWRMEGASAAVRSISYQLQGGRLGTLELSAPRHPKGGRENVSANKDSGEYSCGGIANERLFEILSELVAEAWGESAISWQRQKGIRGTLKFEPALNAREPTNGQSKESPKVVPMGGVRSTERRDSSLPDLPHSKPG